MKTSRRMKRQGWLYLVMLMVPVALLAQNPQRSSSEVQSIAEEAFIFAYPMLESYRLFSAPDTDRPFNRFAHARELSGPESRRVVRPNNDTLYSRTWLDLRTEPMVITLPPVPNGRYWSLQLIDIYTHNVAIFSARNASSDGGRFLVAGPMWKGQEPRGLAGVVRAESQLVYALVRLAVMNEADLPNVARIQEGMRLEPLSSVVGNVQPPTPTPLALPPFLREQAESEGFIQYLNAMLGLVVVHPSEAALVARFGSIGIGANRPFNTGALDGPARTNIRAGARAALEKINAGRQTFAVPRGRWTIADGAFGNRQRMQGRYLARSGAAKFGLYGLDREEAVYMNAAVDSDGTPLDGARSGYSLHFDAKELPPARAFWSITMYDAEGFMVANTLGRYSIGDRTPGLVRGPDGSLTIWISAQAPSSVQANWLPAPAGRFNLSLRMYLPEDSVVDYVPPPVRRVE